MSSKRFACAAAALGLAWAATACAPVDPGFGEAQRYDMAIQTIDPDPVYAEDGAKPGDNGDKAAQATKRYRTGAVKQVQTMSASSGSSGGNGDSASGSGPK